MMPAIIIGVVAVVLVAVLVARFGGSGRGGTNDIDSFRRQIDALSPEARRQTAERMKPSGRSSNSDDGADEH